MNPKLSSESKRTLKERVEELQKRKRAVETELNTATRDIGRGETKKKELEDKIASINKQTRSIIEDMEHGK